MAEGEIGCHTIHKAQTTPTGGDEDAAGGECSYSASQHEQLNLIESKSGTIASGNRSAETEPNISEADSGTIPKIRHPPCITFLCTFCNVHYTRRLDYVMHVRLCHTSNEKFKCDLCVKVCPNYPALMRHKIMAHTGTRYT